MRLSISESSGRLALHSAVENVIAAHRTGEARSVLVNGKNFVVQPNVFDPTIAPSGQVGMCFVAMPWLQDRTVVEIGAGSGIFSSLMAMQRAKRVIATDISQNALRNIDENVARYGLGGVVEVRSGRGLSPISADDRVDLFYCDLPFADWRAPVDELDQAFFDEGLRSVQEVLSDFCSTKFETATMYLCLSSLSRAWCDAECRRLDLEYKRAITVACDLFDLELWRITHK